MLEGLDLVPWSTLTHAYGEATDVPEVLRALAAGDPDALDALYGNIWHQGTVYPATAPAVPFLLELLEGSKTDLPGLLGLLSQIATGSSYLDVHQSLSAPSERPSAEQVEAELVWVRAAREAVRRGTPTFLRLLSHPDEEVRAASVSVLSSCGAVDVEAKAIFEAGLRDRSAVVRASIVFALAGRSGPPEAWFADASPAVRVAAALCRIGHEREPDRRCSDLLLRDAPDALDTFARVPEVAESGDPLRFIIERLGDRWELETQLLEAWMQHERSEVRVGAVFASETLMLASRAAASWLCPALAARLEDDDERVRRWAATLLAQSGTAAAGAADALWRTLERGEPARATPAGSALSALCRLKDPRAATWMETKLRRALAEGEPLGFVGEVVELLGPWAPGCLEPLIALIPHAERGNECIAVITAVAGYGVAASSAIPAIQAELDEHPHITTRVLGDFGLAAAPALSLLRRMVNHEEAWVASNAARAVFRIAGDPAPALALIGDALGKSAITAPLLRLLAELGPAGGSLAAQLHGCFDSEDDWVSVEAAAAWYAVTGEATPALPTLLRHLVPSPRGFVALECLAAVGVEAAAAAPALRAFIDSPQRQVRSGVTSSLIDDDERWVAACKNALSKVSPGGAMAR